MLPTPEAQLFFTEVETSFRGLEHKSAFVRESTPQSVFGNADWTKLTVEADVPEDTYAVWALMEYTAPVVGHAYFDDLSLEVLGPATGRPTPGTIPADARPASSGKPRTAKPAIKSVKKP